MVPPDKHLVPFWGSDAYFDLESPEDREMYSRIQLTKNYLAKSGTERFREYVRTKMEEIKMAKDKKMVEAITSMEEDFAQWYTDVVKKADLID